MWDISARKAKAKPNPHPQPVEDTKIHRVRRCVSPSVSNGLEAREPPPLRSRHPQDTPTARNSEQSPWEL